MVSEIRDFVLFLEARRYAPRTIRHYAKHAVRLGNHLKALGKSFANLTAPEFDRFLTAVARHDADAAPNIEPLHGGLAELSPSLHNQVLFAIKGFYGFLDLRHSSAVFDTVERHRGFEAPSLKFGAQIPPKAPRGACHCSNAGAQAPAQYATRRPGN